MKNQFAVKVSHGLDQKGEYSHAENFFDNRIIESTLSYNVNDYYYMTREEAEQRLAEANAFIKKCEDELGWIPGIVTAWIDEWNQEINKEETL